MKISQEILFFSPRSRTINIGGQRKRPVFDTGTENMKLRKRYPLALIILVLSIGLFVVVVNHKELVEARETAERGNDKGQLSLGIMYYNGQGVAQDYTEAAKWYRRAAEQGLPKAQFMLGVLYHDGRGVKQDNVRAHMWYDLAASSFEGKKKIRTTQFRDIVANNMTQAQIIEAQKLAREWKPRLESSIIRNAFLSGANLKDGPLKDGYLNDLDQIRFLDLMDGTRSIEVNFKQGKEESLAIFESKDRYDEHTIKIKGKENIKADVGYTWLQAIGTADLSGKGYEDIFFVGWDFGSAMHSLYLNIYSVANNEIVTLEMIFSHNICDPITPIQVSENYRDEKFSREREFLEKIKFSYGYLDAQMIQNNSDNPTRVPCLLQTAKSTIGIIIRTSILPPWVRIILSKYPMVYSWRNLYNLAGSSGVDRKLEKGI